MRTAVRPLGCQRSVVSVGCVYSVNSNCTKIPNTGKATKGSLRILDLYDFRVCS